MEVELEARVKTLGYKVKAMSRESPSQKAAHVLDTDLRNHWSTATNTKEWILLELDEPCLLSHIRIYNKSVLEWEISVGLRYKPETFVKVRPRCEAPRRDMVYPMNYTPCRYVRISCLRGNPIAIFYIQLMGLTVHGLEPEFQPVVNHLLPNIISHKQDDHDIHLQFLQDMTNRLVTFLPQLEADLNSFSEAPESNLRFLAMLAGPFYPILQIVNERESVRLTSSVSDSEAFRNSHPSTSLTVSSNFEPRRSRNTSPFFLPTASYLVFRPDAVLTLLRKAYKDSNLGNVCRMASRILQRLIGPITEQEASSPYSNVEEASNNEPGVHLSSSNYSDLFGEEFLITNDKWDSNYLNVLDIASAEEGVLHILYACASQPLLCSKLADVNSDLWSALPLVQALLPALRPNFSSLDHIDENFSQWKQPFVQHALSQIVATASSSIYRPLLRACAGYLSSFSPSHAKAACVLIDLCSGVLAPWIPQVIAKVDLAVELLEDLLGVVQASHQSFDRARAAIKYIVLALSGNMDDIMSKYKDVKLRILFLVEMLEPYLDPAITPIKSTIAFGNMPSSFLENQEHTCDIALNVIRTAIKKSAVLPLLEAEWRKGTVAPSVLLSILEPYLRLPLDIDLRKFPVLESLEPHSSAVTNVSPFSRIGGAISKSHVEVADGKADMSDTFGKVDTSEDASLLFAPPELCRMSLTNFSASLEGKSSESSCCNIKTEMTHVLKSSSSPSDNSLALDSVDNVEYLNLKADYVKLTNYRECELRATEFRRLAQDLHSQSQITPEGHDATVDSFLLAAECYVNPYFAMSFNGTRDVICKRNVNGTSRNQIIEDIRMVLEESDNDLKVFVDLERKRDKIVLEILLEAAKLDKEYQKMSLEADGDSISYDDGNDQVINMSQHDILSVDAITLVRQNQSLLCNFLVRRLQREKHSMHEILMQSLLFYLNSATRLYCSPECIVDILLKSAEYFNGLLTSLYYQFKEGSLKLDQFKLLEVQRRWMLLKRLAIASSGGDEGLSLSRNIKSGLRFANLIPASAWLERVPVFSSSASPLVRYLGWMSVSRNAKQYLNERLFLASDLSQLSHLLSIFSDDLARIDNIVQKNEIGVVEKSGVKQHIDNEKEHEQPDQQYVQQHLYAIYPDIAHFFPTMKRQFEAFGKTILEAVGLQLRSIPSSNVPDILCWFSDLCSWPFVQEISDQISSRDISSGFKGSVAKNAKAVILYTLEAIVTEHMEAMIPEIPRLVQVLLSLSRSKCCDVSFLESILSLLKPIISYSLEKVPDEETLFIDHSCRNFEALCFDELFDNIKHIDEAASPLENRYSRALTIFLLASVFPDLSVHRKIQMLNSSIFWAGFASFEPTTSFHNYLCAYQVLIESCKDLLIETLKIRGFTPLHMYLDSEACIGAAGDEKSDSKSWFLGDICHSSNATELSKELPTRTYDVAHVSRKAGQLTTEEIRIFCQYLDSLISKLNSTIELCCKLHYKLASKLASASAECFVYLRCLSSIVDKVPVNIEFEKENLEASGNESLDQIPDYWRISLEKFAKRIVQLQEDHCWEVALMMLNCLLEVSRWLFVDNVIGEICCALKNFSCRAPNISWRLQTDKWMSLLFTRGMHGLNGSETPLIDLFCALLGHPEPEQRFIALKHMRKLVGQNMEHGAAWSSSTPFSEVAFTGSVISASKQILSALVLKTWDQVTLLASSDISLQLRIHAMALLMNSILFAERHQVQAFLVSTDKFLHLTNHAQPTCEGPLKKVSLALLASVCLYTPAEDVYLIPVTVWRNIETLGEAQNERCPTGLEQKICQALCRIKSEGEEAKQFLKEVLFSSSSKQQEHDFGRTRESILQVVAGLSSTKSYFDLFAEETDQKAMELEEAEMELELLQNEHAVNQSSKDSKASAKDENRLQQIKEEIRSLEKAKLREEILARRQKKLVLKHARQKYLEEAAFQEAELLQELDRERTAEVEKEIERQRLLEQERAKTRELRYNLDIEKEKQSQRDLQRELEQVESGVRPSRREFSSSNSRPRDRFRERENGRAGSDGNLRASSGSSQQPDSVPKVVLSGGARQFSGQQQLPTILQSYDRSDECGSSYEEFFDGSKDSGDAGSVGDPEMVSSLDGQPFGSAQRHGSRGSKSRQIMERREREGGRREGKWERKH